MKAVILAGGLGTRLSEETGVRPKPMAEIGGKPILWHIMKTYSHYGVNDFVICLGYKGHMIKEYFANYWLHNCDITFDIANNTAEVHQNSSEPWKVTLVDTGAETMTGGRLKRVADHVSDGTFLMTYGDGVADIDIEALIAFHKGNGRAATVTAVQPVGRFGAMEIAGDGQSVSSFWEKPDGDGDWVNGGYFVLEPEVLERIQDDGSIWEREPLESLAEDGELGAYKHHGFWRPMDTLKDKTDLNELWHSGSAPWKVW